MSSPANIDSLHPLEIKVLRTLGTHESPLTDARLAELTGLAPSQVSMAVGWLLTKALVHLSSEHTTTYVSATDLFPLDTQRCKRETLPKAYAGGWLIAMDHDIDNKIVRLKYDGLKYTCDKVI